MVEGRASLDSAVSEGVVPDKGAGATQDNTLKPEEKEETRRRLSSLGHHARGQFERSVLSRSAISTVLSDPQSQMLLAYPQPPGSSVSLAVNLLGL